MAKNQIPDIVVSRLPRYLRALDHMLHNGIKTTSSQELGDAIGISAAQIRKDLSQFGELANGYGYRRILSNNEAILTRPNWDRLWLRWRSWFCTGSYQGFVQGFQDRLDGQ